MFRMFRV